MNMKKFLVGVVMLLLVFASAQLVTAFTSETFYHGQTDQEYTVAYAGDTILVGSVVSFAPNTYNSFFTDGLHDTGSWVIRAADENDSYVVGIAVWAAVPEQLVKIQTWGIGAAIVDGQDSDVSALKVGDGLSVSANNGWLGSVMQNKWADATIAIQQYNQVAVLLEPVAVTKIGDTETFSVFIRMR